MLDSATFYVDQDRLICTPTGWWREKRRRGLAPSEIHGLASLNMRVLWNREGVERVVPRARLREMARHLDHAERLSEEVFTNRLTIRWSELSAASDRSPDPVLSAQ